MGNAHHQAIQASSQWVVRVLQSTHIVRIAIREPEDLEGSYIYPDMNREMCASSFLTVPKRISISLAFQT